MEVIDSIKDVSLVKAALSGAIVAVVQVAKVARVIPEPERWIPAVALVLGVAGGLYYRLDLLEAIMLGPTAVGVFEFGNRVVLGRTKQGGFIERDRPYTDEGFRAGNNADWEAFVTTTQVPLRRSIERSGVHGPDAEDLMQDAYLNVYNKRGSIDLTGNVVSYINSTGHNLAVDHNRRSYGRRAQVVTDASTTDANELTSLERTPWSLNVEDQALAEIDLQTVNATLPTLSPINREAILMATAGYSHTEIAEATDTALGTVKSRVARGRNQLLAALETEQDPTSSTTLR